MIFFIIIIWNDAPNNGPIEIKVISPSNIPVGHEFIFKLINNKTDWILVNLTTGDTVFLNTQLKLFKNR